MGHRTGRGERLLAHITHDGYLLHRSRRETWLGALADALYPVRAKAPVLRRGRINQLAWSRTGGALRRVMDRTPRGKVAG